MILEKSLIPEDATPEEVLKETNELIDKFNFLIKHISLSQNFDGQMLENVEFAAGEDKEIYHKLGIRPKYRIILRQEGNGVLSDTPSGWNKYKIQIKNNGASSVKATILLVKE